MYKNILIPVDLAHKDTVGPMLAAAKALGDKDANVTLLYVMPEIPGYIATDLPADSTAVAKASIEAQLRNLATDNNAPKNTRVLTGSGRPHHNILETANNGGIDLIVIMSHQPGFADYLLGSVAARVVRHAHCSVHVIR